MAVVISPVRAASEINDNLLKVTWRSNTPIRQHARYGQTGTGKTYTMLGDGIESALAAGGDTTTVSATVAAAAAGAQPGAPAAWGIVPRVLSDLFRDIAKLPPNTIATVTCSYLQVYNNSVFDLLQDPERQRSLTLRERSAKVQDVEGTRTHVFVQGLSEFNVTSLNEVRACVRACVGGLVGAWVVASPRQWHVWCRC